MSNNKIILKPVGKMNKATKLEKQKRRSLFQPTRQPHNYFEQIMPQSINEKTIQQKGDISNRRLLASTTEEKPEIKFKLIEDPRQSQFSYRKYIVVQKILLILSLLSFLVEVLNTEIYVLEVTQVIGKQWRISTHVEMTCSFFTILLSLCMLLRYVTLNELEIDQKKYYCLKSGYGIFYQIYRFMSNFNLLKYFLLEVFIILFHPLYFFHDYEIELFESYDQLYLKHRVNDLLSLLSLCRLYIVIRSMINLTIYSTPRAYRLCGQNRVEHSLIFSIKCLLKQQPVKIITLAFLLQQIILGFGLKLSQGNLIYNNPQLTTSTATGFENYINCYWCIFITMATVGYGDYYPKTLPGRFVGLIAALSGIILSSLLIVSLSAYLTMQNNEQKSHLTLIRLNNQSKLKQQATQVLLETMRMTKYLSSQQKSTEEKIKEFFIMLKHKIDIVKFRTRKIKSIVNNNNIIEEMDRLFEVFQEALRQSFAYQLELKKELERLSNNCLIERKMQTIFLTHNMEEIIAKKL